MFFSLMNLLSTDKAADAREHGFPKPQPRKKIAQESMGVVV